MKRRAIPLVLFALLAFLVQPIQAHESPVDHVGREIRLWWADGKVHVTYRLLLTERAALLQLGAIDRDHDGKISDDERRTYFSNFASDLAGQFQLTIEGKPVKLHTDGEVALDPALGQTYQFATDDIALPPGKHAAELRDSYSRAYPGPYRLLPTPSASADKIEIPPPPTTNENETHPGMVIVKFELNVPPANAGR